MVRTKQSIERERERGCHLCLASIYIREVQKERSRRSNCRHWNFNGLTSGGMDTNETNGTHVFFQHHSFDTLSFWTCCKVHTCRFGSYHENIYICNSPLNKMQAVNTSVCVSCPHNAFDTLLFGTCQKVHKFLTRCWVLSMVFWGGRS